MTAFLEHMQDFLKPLMCLILCIYSILGQKLQYFIDVSYQSKCFIGPLLVKKVHVFNEFKSTK